MPTLQQRIGQPTPSSCPHLRICRHPPYNNQESQNQNCFAYRRQQRPGESESASAKESIVIFKGYLRIPTTPASQQQSSTALEVCHCSFKVHLSFQVPSLLSSTLRTYGTLQSRTISPPNAGISTHASAECALETGQVRNGTQILSQRP